MQWLVRHVYAPVMIVGAGGMAIWLGSRDAGPGAFGLVIAVAIALSFVAEARAPYAPAWNRSHGDAGRDAVHAVVNEATSLASVAVLPFVATATPSPWWPHGWPFPLQVAAAILVFDAGVTLAHWQSHRRIWLWRFHAVHHGVARLYGLNGIMKHPVHQAIEMLAGVTPLVVLGMPPAVASTLAACTAIQLLLQHSNVDYRVGIAGRVLALNAGHRFHHQRAAGMGDVNFGLFTTLWDRLLGTWTFDPARRFTSADLGIAGRPDPPRSYLAQLVEPFRRA